MNNDIYAEWLVKRKKSPLTVPFYIGIVLLFLIGFYVSVISPFGFVALLAAAAAAYQFFAVFCFRLFGRSFFQGN